MKTIKSTTIFLLSLILSSCDPIPQAFMVNNYHSPIYYLIPEKNCISVYPDTILPVDYINSDAFYHFKSEAKDTSVFFECMGCSVKDELFCNNDTLSIYIFNADTVDCYSWDTIIKHNRVLQRYDISFKDFFTYPNSRWIDLHWFYFPPTEDMKHIHMWPPYGTYDEHGKRKKN